jgi:hypothetical protein
VKFSYLTGRAVAQYAYRMEGSSQGRGISALVAINDQEFLVLERNNRGLGVEAEFSPLNKKVYRISLKGATDVSAIDLDAPGAVFTPVSKEATPWLDLAANVGDSSLAALGALTPEKWEGLAVGPKLADGSYLVLAGTDNDYSVTQLPPPAGSSAVQFDRYYKPTAPGAAVPVERIQCDIGTLDNCFVVNPDATIGAPVPAGFDFTSYELVPGVLQAYKASAADLKGLTRVQLPWQKRGF